MISSMTGGVYHGIRIIRSILRISIFSKATFMPWQAVAGPIELRYSRRRAEAGRAGCAKQENVVAK
jgi:hypothetical protein